MIELEQYLEQFGRMDQNVARTPLYVRLKVAFYPVTIKYMWDNTAF